MAKKATKKKAASKTRKAAAKPAASNGKIASSDKARTKSEIYRELSEHSGVGKKEVVAIFDTMNEMIKKDLGRRGPGTFTVPGLLKLRVVRKPATKARKGVNPFTGEPTVFKAKPARNVVKATPLKSLKDMV